MEFTGARDDRVAVASADADQLHFTTDMPAPHHSSFNKPDAVPDAQSTLSKH